MALAERLLAAEFNKPGHTVIDHRTWVFLGDGCLMEGISHEACSLAGTWRLNKLVAFYDDNGISIDGDVKGWFGDDTPARFEAYGWTVIRNVDGHDRLALDAAIEAAKSAGQPVLICCKTQIGHGSPNRAGTAKAHGEALGRRDRADARAARLALAGLRDSGRSVRAWLVGTRRGAHRRAATGSAASAPMPRRIRIVRTSCCAATPARRCPPRPSRLSPRRSATRKLRATVATPPQGLAGTAQRGGAGAARAAGRLGRPDRLQPTDWKGHKPLLGEGTGNHCTTACASSAWPRS